MAGKSRLDAAIFERNLADSRSKAAALIKAGAVKVNGETADKPALLIAETDDITVTRAAAEYVGRGGYKLAAAINEFSLADKIKGAVCLDVGASTGGFTDCMLQTGAETVYAVDVGTGQLAGKLRGDSRVLSMEHYNFRNAVPEDFSVLPSFAAVDVSFISLSLVLPPLYRVLYESAAAVALIKPQFEVGQGKLNKNGIVTDESARKGAVAMAERSAREAGFTVKGTMVSPIEGGDGNIEYLMYLEKMKEEQK